MLDQAIPRGSRVTIQFVGTVFSAAEAGSSEVFVEGLGLRPMHFGRELITCLLPPIQKPGATVANTATDEYGEVVIHDPNTASYVVRVGDALQVWPDDQHTLPAGPEPREPPVRVPEAVVAEAMIQAEPAKCDHCGKLGGDHDDDCPEAIPF